MRNLHYNISYDFDDKGKEFNQIIKEYFFIYLKDLKKQEKL